MTGRNEPKRGIAAKRRKDRKKEIESELMAAGGVQISMQIGTPSWSPASKS
jgi:hypothetical protein